jgi:diguanylate cyclase (GGDEF)-like protein
LAGAINAVTMQQLESGGFSSALEEAMERLHDQHEDLTVDEQQEPGAELDDTRRREQYLAYHDALTGLPNRTLFQDRLDQALVQARRRSERVGVLFVDLDGFKAVNDTWGHQAGDALLQEVSSRLQTCVRESDTVARRGGDEFCVVLTNLAHADDATLVARKILQRLTQLIVVEGRQIQISASVGISLYPADGTSAEVLVQNADLAMYKAKRQGKNTYEIYDASLQQR